ncbi:MULTISPECIES: winged helix-turn-helix domain-containing protein [unclassified Streptomyces]|uniref:winged helix-turn-helix domain-containing protein n=1 Tax=Streptomyces sp. NBC_01728 TaxID=2975925 RepID=UPI002B1CDAC2|nr:MULTISPECIES: winged helix-turn-helix domain-containing protein [unclassified Streptomyces]
MSLWPSALYHGWADQRWTLARVKKLIGRLFRISYTVEGTWRLLKRHSWSWHQPARRAIERNDDAVELRKKEVWPRVAGMSCYTTGERARLIYAVREYRGRKNQPKGFGSRDFRALLVRARIQVGGPIVLVRGNVSIHLTADLREFFATNTDWLTGFQLPAYAPDLNPQEGVWSVVKRDLGNLAAADLGQITGTVKRRKLKMLQYRPQVLDGCLADSGLALDE